MVRLLSALAGVALLAASSGVANHLSTAPSTTAPMATVQAMPTLPDPDEEQGGGPCWVRICSGGQCTWYQMCLSA